MWAKLKQMQPFGALAWGRFPLLPPHKILPWKHPVRKNKKFANIHHILIILIKMIIISRSCVPILLRFVFPQLGNFKAMVETRVGAAAGASSWWTSRSIFMHPCQGKICLTGRTLEQDRVHGEGRPCCGEDREEQTHQTCLWVLHCRDSLSLDFLLCGCCWLLCSLAPVLSRLMLMLAVSVT